MNSEDQYWIFMNKIKSGAPSKILKEEKDKTNNMTHGFTIDEVKCKVYIHYYII